MLIYFVPANAQTNIWQDLDANRTQQPDKQIMPNVYRAVSLNQQALQNVLINAPSESAVSVKNSSVILTLPMPDGSYQDFRIVGSSIMESALAAKYPSMQTYSGQGVDDPAASVRFGWTPLGFHAIILSSTGAIFIETFSVNDTENYMVYYMRDVPVPPDYKGCEVQSSPMLEEYLDGLPSEKLTGPTLRTFRLAMAATGEYTAQYGGSVANAQAAIVTVMNQVNAIYERDVAIRMILIANNDTLIYTDATNDPYSNVNGNPCDANPRAQNQTTIDAIIGTANYDIGHLFTGTNIGGCASIGSVCSGANKARGVSGVQLGSAFDIGLTAHEMGHQFSANHTFNSITTSICSGQVTPTSAYEPGSGTTIMSYAGSCGADMIQGARDMFFHTHSYSQMDAFVTSGGGSGCVTTQATGNSEPNVNAGPGGFTIPISTPFTLTGSGNDPDGDPLTFSWEQYDVGPQGSPNSPSGNAPLFRFFPPVNAPVRTFPQWSDILNNTQTLGEILPSYTRSMTFRLVARDNVPNGGGVDFATTSVDVTATAGPFLVTSQNSSTMWCVGSSQAITWDVANTTAAPVSVANVNIKLSTDGGLTYPITLAASTPNDGTENITVPNNPVNNNARIMVEAADNIFFDINNTNFTINAAPIVVSHPTDVNAEWGDNVSFSVSFSGVPTPTVQWQLSTDGGSNYNDIPGANSSTLNLSCVTLDMDGYKYRAELTNVCDVIYSNAATLNVVPRNATATITVDPDPQQYSDKVDISVTITEANVCGESAATGAEVYIGTQLMGTITFTANGSNLEGSLDTVALQEPTPYGTAPTGQMAPGIQNVTIVLLGTNSNFNVSNPGTTLEILPEDARAYYTGACFASTSGVNSSSAIVTLSATITDITYETGDPDYDPCPGDIRNATLSFIDRGTNTIIASNVPIGLVDPNDPLVAVGTYDWNVNIVGMSETFEIGIIVDGYYTRDHADDNVLVTVSQPLPDFVTGGGYLILQNPAGMVAGNVGSKNNFGFNVKFNKKGTNLQGNMTTMIRKTEVDGLHIYKIKANNIKSLAVQPSSSGGKATINAKASIQDVTDPLNVISVDGNASLQIKLSDWGNPGNQVDSIAITIWEKFGGLWYASNWTGTNTQEQQIDAGNLSISSNSSFARTIVDGAGVEQVSVYPNPAVEHFNLEFMTEQAGWYEIKLLDIMGRDVVYMLYNAEIGFNSAVIESEGLTPGVYSLVLIGDKTIIGTKRVVVN